MKKPIHDQGRSIQVAQLTGSRDDIVTYRKGRKCRLPRCRQPLSSYTPGPYCNIHQHIGAIIEMEKADKRKKLLSQKACARHKAKLDAKRGGKPKKTWNKEKTKNYFPNYTCKECKGRFHRATDAANYWTQEFCRTCRPIIKAKEGIK